VKSRRTSSSCEEPQVHRPGGHGGRQRDTVAATKKGIIVATSREHTISAAEHTVGLILALARKHPQAYKSLKQRMEARQFVGTELQGKTLGLVGFGRIGKEVATRLIAFG